MNTLSPFLRHISRLLVAAMLLMNFNIAVAHAVMLPTESVLSSAAFPNAREKLKTLIGRQEVRERFMALGVAPELVQQRVDALSNEEADRLASRIDALPAAGGDILGVVLIVFLILLITDLLGFTDVYPFTKKGSARR